MTTSHRFLKGFFSALILGMVSVVLGAGGAFAKEDKDKDKTPPVVSNLHAESITDISAVIVWTTNEPADSSVTYGIAPKTNINGPDDAAYVLSHAIALSELTPETTYAYCIRTRDESNNKTDVCETFTTTAVTPPPPPPPEEPTPPGGENLPPTRSFISGFAYPYAPIEITLKEIPRGNTYRQTTRANEKGIFYLSIEDFPRSLYSFLISAKDQDGVGSIRKGIQFEFKHGTAPLYIRKVILPPTIVVEADVVAFGDDITVSGSATPHTGVLIEVDNILYETKTDGDGRYRILINTARLAPGKLSLRARSTMISGFGNDFSLTKTVTLSSTSVPEADMNQDGVVDIKDFSIFLTGPKDMNTDGAIDAADVSIFLRAF